jgi:hypothetical protein
LLAVGSNLGIAAAASNVPPDFQKYFGGSAAASGIPAKFQGYWNVSKQECKDEESKTAFLLNPTEPISMTFAVN